jgi:uncharacterized protein (DUF433 family)
MDIVTTGHTPTIDWRKSSIAEMRAARSIADEEWMAERLRHASLLLRDSIEVDPNRRGGIPVLRGTHFTIAQMLQELAEGKSIPDIARRFRIDPAKMRQILESLAIYMDRSPFE